MIHFLLHWLGLDNASGTQYLWWSGIFGDVTIFSGIVYGLRQLKKHGECHEDTCHKHGKYGFLDTKNNIKYKLCEDHHPGVPKKLTHLHIVKLHKSAKLKK